MLTTITSIFKQVNQGVCGNILFPFFTPKNVCVACSTCWKHDLWMLGQFEKSQKNNKLLQVSQSVQWCNTNYALAS